MPIQYHASSKTFHLFNDEISYIFMILANGELGHLYYGKAIRDRESFAHLFVLQARALAPVAYRDDLSFSLEVIKQEYPSYGTGDFREPAVQITTSIGDKISHFIYKEHTMMEGKPRFDGLPATFSDGGEAQTLAITLYDELIACELTLYYTIFHDLAVITRSSRVENKGAQPIKIDRLMSTSIDFYDNHFVMMQLDGAWSRERHVQERPLLNGIQAISSARGASGAFHNPFLALRRPQTTESQGEVYGFTLVYSGNFLAQVEVDSYDVSRLLLGIHPFGFGWNLTTNEHFQSPEAVMVYSDGGLNQMSQTFHQLFQDHLMPKRWARELRPILINNWEATYFDFDHHKIIAIAQQAKEVGIELFVLDDGWFGHRDNDKSSLGDWFVHKEKLPQGLSALAREIKALGLKFGLWFEPEMVNEVSKLYRMHPEWTIGVPNRHKTYSRHQYVLDFSQAVVVDTVFTMMDKILADGLIDYIKWDMNRNITEAYSASLPADRQGEFFHRYILGVYQLYDRLITKYPNILFESCASGGGRFDAGMLFYAPQAWTSDNMDPIERLAIQHGTSMLYPLISMGSHVPTSPNHQVDRHTSLAMRASVAYFGTFGYELDITKISADERTEIVRQIAFFKQWQSVIALGKFYRLESADPNYYYWMVVSQDKEQALVASYKILARANPALKRFNLQGLNPNLLYYCPERELSYYGDELMHVGWLSEPEFTGMSGTDKGDFTARIYQLLAKK
ncbi:alpha-galactosidase [Entomospira culicis]|uniref:Alpha-galactosidase n=1 Tax=Entomospira culicis TaxID=2719989 RepID=A0A968GGA1_9SPIO|nr:alpha-galactosidase [Entomospira culicis]NIZ19056.1 alpha-galactosidase [Entomospira culicis]NIZ69271.1 alpha-galactosidase [Entomospira culicis]WDI37854.1 alpha-galactosidase [Entomospira culicis]WDI39482.1 alpha-galactosidase [Entomospira culicis]